MEKINLKEVQETALIPLAIKANETKRSKARIKDEKAVEIIDSLDIDTKQYDKFLSHEGVIARTILIDNFVKSYIKRHPNAVILNIGCGFDDRFSRVHNDKILWYDIDLPESIDVRQKVYKDTKNRIMIKADVLKDDWTQSIQKRKRTLVIMEGFLMYFSREQVQTILNHLVDAFDKVTIICELMHPFATSNEKAHDTVKYTGAHFQWGTKTGKDLLPLCNRLKLIKEVSISNIMKKQTLRGRLFCLAVGRMNNRIAIYTAY